MPRIQRERCRTAVRNVCDTIAWPALAARVASRAEPGMTAIEVKRLLDEADGMLDAWALSEPAVCSLVKEIHDRRGALSG